MYYTHNEEGDTFIFDETSKKAFLCREFREIPQLPTEACKPTGKGNEKVLEIDTRGWTDASDSQPTMLK
jgi:hypothetical protein